jgi:mannitol-1-phosphate 5-dehydrogenase
MKKAVMYGAGNIGRGFIGQLLSQSGYEVVFLDINEKVINTLNKDKKYTITTVSNESTNQIVITNIRAINTNINPEEAIHEIKTCDIMATAVGANILKYISPIVAKGLYERSKLKAKPLNILLCENLMNVHHYFKSLLEIELTGSSEQTLKNIGFVEASIGRMVPVMLETTYPTDITVESFEVLHTDKEGFIEEIPQIKNMIAYAPFDVYIYRKLFMHNMGHAVTAYLGNLKGYTYIDEAISDTQIKYCVYACGLESAKAIAADGYPLAALIDFYDRLIYRFNNHKLKDTINRVGRDTKRKLTEQDRLTGAVNLCIKKNTPYAFLLLGIASGLLFEGEEDKESHQVYTEAKKDLIKAIKTYTNMNNEQDIKAIETIYHLLAKKDITSAIHYCERLKASKIKD